MELERKSLEATIDTITDATDEAPFGGFTAVASDASRDRDGENLTQDEWITPLPDHITIDVDHGMSVATTVGSAHPYFSDSGEMMIQASFSSLARAQEVRTLINEGHIKTVSVACLVDKSKKSGTPKRELLNVGIVAIPSNRNAVILASKAFAPQSAVEAAQQLLLAIKAGTAAGNSDGAMVQAIHDAAGHLGAACIVVEVPVEQGPGDPSGTDDGANKSFTKAESVVLKDADDDPRKLLAGIDAILDQAIGLTANIDRQSLPEPVGQALDLLVGAEESVDALMDLMGVYDPDDAEDTAMRVAALSEGITLEAFQAALAFITSKTPSDEIVTGEPLADSPADLPVEKAATAADVAPVPADEAASEAADDDAVTVEKRAAHMAMLMWADSLDS